MTRWTRVVGLTLVAVAALTLTPGHERPLDAPTRVEPLGPAGSAVLPHLATRS